MSAITQAKINQTLLELVQGDITEQDVDAIVNAANSSLAGGSGVDGAIHRAAGPQLVQASIQLAPCPTGEARITPGFQLKARYVIHTVGPIYSSAAQSAPLLAAAHHNSLKLAQENGVKSIAFPAISTGVYGYPINEAAQVALNAVADMINENQPDFELVRFVLFSASALTMFSRALADLADTHAGVSAS